MYGNSTGFLRRLTAAVALMLGGALAGYAPAQQAPSTATETAPPEVVVTGSRIFQTEAQREQPLSIITSEAIEKTGLTDIGTLLGQLTTGGSSLNTKFNSSGNFGYPPDGGGIGAGVLRVDGPGRTARDCRAAFYLLVVCRDGVSKSCGGGHVAVRTSRGERIGVAGDDTICHRRACGSDRGALA